MDDMHRVMCWTTPERLAGYRRGLVPINPAESKAAIEELAGRVEALSADAKESRRVLSALVGAIVDREERGYMALPALMRAIDAGRALLAGPEDATDGE